jgi:hypothetical protein
VADRVLVLTDPELHWLIAIVAQRIGDMQRQLQQVSPDGATREYLDQSVLELKRISTKLSHASVR